jgi:ketosteroid isomerase-like protein
MPQVNVETVRKLYDAYLERDRDRVVELVHPEVEWHTIAGALFGVDVLHGRGELVGFLFDQILEGVPDFAAVIEEVTELDGTQVLVVCHYEGHGGRSGARVAMDTAAIYRVERGLIASFKEFSTRAEAIRAADQADR